MPIVTDGDGVGIAYAIPDNIKNLITDDFLKEFRNQLFRIHEHYSLDTFADFGIPTNTSTGGWYASFGKACLLTHKEELLDYWRTLPWYDSDIFDGELANMLVAKGFILDDLTKVIEEQLGIKSDDIVMCNECGKFYSKDMVIEIEDEEELYFTPYICLFCNDVKNTLDGNKHATDYYRKTLEELDEYTKSHPIDNEEK